MDDIIDLIQGLYVVYNPKANLDGGAMVLLIRQYERALSGCDVETVRKACEVWQYERESKRFPYPNEFLNCIQVVKRKPADTSASEPWRQVAKGDYDAMTVSEKERYLQILAHEYRTLGGGMYGRGKGEGWVHPERAAKYHPLADRCEAEAKRLGEIVRSARAKDGIKAIGSAYDMKHVSEILPFAVQS